MVLPTTNKTVYPMLVKHACLISQDGSASFINKPVKDVDKRKQLAIIVFDSCMRREANELRDVLQAVAVKILVLSGYLKPRYEAQRIRPQRVHTKSCCWSVSGLFLLSSCKLSLYLIPRIFFSIQICIKRRYVVYDFSPRSIQDLEKDPITLLRKERLAAYFCKMHRLASCRSSYSSRFVLASRIDPAMLIPAMSLYLFESTADITTRQTSSRVLHGTEEAGTERKLRNARNWSCWIAQRGLPVVISP
jgi:hypothetical protein